MRIKPPKNGWTLSIFYMINLIFTAYRHKKHYQYDDSAESYLICSNKDLHYYPFTISHFRRILVAGVATPFHRHSISECLSEANPYRMSDAERYA